MDLTVKRKLLLLTALSILAMIAVGGTGYYGQSEQARSLSDMTVKLRALRNHLESDMMHDALRGDVLSALYATMSGDLEARGEIEAALAEHVATFESKLADSASLTLPTEVTDALGRVTPSLEAYVASAESIVRTSFADVDAARAALPDFMSAFERLEGDMETLSDVIESSATEAEEAARAIAAASRTTMIGVAIVAAALCLLVSLAVTRSIGKPLGELRAAIEAIRDNPDAVERIAGFKAEFLGIQTAFNAVLDNLEDQRAEELARAEGAFRVRQALDASTANVVLADANLEIIYVNNAAQGMFERMSSDFETLGADFDAQQLLGRKLSVFFPDKNQLGAITYSSQPREDEVVIGGRTLRITSTAVIGEQGQRIGTVLEWTDLTQQREAERQIENVLADAVDGRLDTRLDPASLSGFMRALAQSINSMLDAITEPLSVAQTNLKMIAEGNLPPPITDAFRGEFDAMRVNLNTCTDVLRLLVEDTGSLVAAATEGRLDQRADADRHWGTYRTIVEGINNTLDAIAQPVAEVREVVTGFAAGDLDRRMTGDYRGEFAVLSDAVTTSVTNLADMVARIHGASNSISMSATEVSRGNQDLNQRTQEQAAALEETSSSLQGLTDRSKQNAASAREADNLAQVALSEAEKGGRIVTDAMTAMNKINESSKRIADIISVIDGIAFQTNLLALNAAVEAARAGEQGRGFAVVATEVRNLAQNSASAAREIKELINDSVSKVDHGSQLVNASGETLRDIVTAVNKVGAIISEITDATEQQMISFDEVGVAISQIDNMTQQNAALVEQATAASESMAGDAASMKELMSFFKVGDSGGRPAAATPAAMAGKGVKAGTRSNLSVVAPKRVVNGGAQSDDWSEF